jgi:GntR family transcriptional regulator
VTGPQVIGQLAPRRRRPKSLSGAIAGELRAALEAGSLAPDGRLPSEPELARQLGVSRATVREAVAALEEQGLVRRRQGAGTFVQRNYSIVRNNLNLNAGVTDLIRAAGRTPGTLRRRFVVRGATPGEIGQLDLPAGSQVFEVSRVRTADDRPVAFVVAALPLRLLEEHGFAPADAEMVLRAEESTYAGLEAMGISVTYGQAELRFEFATAAIARELDVKPRTPLIDLVQVDHAADDMPVLASHERFLLDVVSLRVYRKGPA